MAAALVGANIASDKPGLGAGEAQIYDTKPLEDKIQQQILLQQRKNDIQDQQNAEALSKIDLNGVRAADKGDVNQMHNDTYKAFRALQLAHANNDRGGAIQAQADLDRAMSDEKSFIAQSSDENKRQALQYADIVHNRSSYTNDAINGIQTAMTTPLKAANYNDVSNINKYVKEPAKVDLNAMFDGFQKESMVKSDPKVVYDNGSKFDSYTMRLSEPVLEKRATLGYTADHDKKDAIDQLYDPAKFDPDQKAHLEQIVGHPLTTAPQIAAADYWNTNRQVSDATDRKQVTEKTPRAAATVINFGNGGEGGVGSVSPINVANTEPATVTTHYQNAPDKKTTIQRVVTKQSTPIDGFSFPEIKLDLPNSGALRDASKGAGLDGAGVKTVVGTQLTVMPVYKSGPNSGNIVSDEDLGSAKQSGNVQYKIMMHGNQGNVVGMSADGQHFTFSKDPTPVYVPATSSATDMIQQKATKQNLPSVQNKLRQLYQEVSQKNAEIGQSGQSAPQQNSTPKIHSTKKIDY